MKNKKLRACVCVRINVVRLYFFVFFRQLTNVLSIHLLHTHTYPRCGIDWKKKRERESRDERKETNKGLTTE